MYKLILITAFTIFSLYGYSQNTKDNKDTIRDADEPIFTSVQVEAAFPGGRDAWKTYLQKNLNSSLPKDKGAPAGKYTVIANFLVDYHGNISDVQADPSPYGTKEEAIRVIKNGPQWIPAMQNGHNVAYRARQAITFVVSEENTAINTDNRVFTSVQIEAEFPGGSEGWKTYLTKNLDSNIPYKKGAPSGRFPVFVNFLVDREGNISDVQAPPSPYGTREEAIRVIQNGPRWRPAVQNGRNVAYRARQVITFVVTR